MRHERHRHADLLFDFGGVAMGEDAVRRDAAVALGEVRALGRRLAGAGDARLRVDDHARLDQPRRARAAAARGSPPSDSTRRTRRACASRRSLAIVLGQPVCRVPVRRRMRIPLLPCRRVAQAERSRQIEHPRAARARAPARRPPRPRRAPPGTRRRFPPTSRSTSRGSTGASQIRAAPGSLRPSDPADAIARRTSACGCRRVSA